jgi:hypothetical protein
VTRRLREAIDAFAVDRAPELVEEARAEAVAKVRRVLAETMTESLLAQSQQALRPSEGTRARPSRKPRPPGKPHSDHPPPERVAGKVREAPSGTAAELAYYVYGVASRRIEVPGELAGVDPRYEVSRVEEGGLAAIVSPVSLSEFGEEPLHDNLNDVAWLEEKARAHEHVLDAVLQRGTVVPLRLCTIYSGEEQIREMLAEEGAVMLDALDRLDGKAEWGVKAIAEPGALERAVAQRLDDGPEAKASGGTAYMQRKGRQAREKAELEGLADEWAAAIHDPLADAVAEALLNPLQRPEVSGHEGDMLLNGVYLIADEARPAFRELVDRIAEEYRARGVSVELTGPWPPYNFVKSSIESAR